MDSKEIQAILTLLEDPDREIYEAVFQSLMNKGIDVVPDLERAWEVTANSETQDRIENIIYKIQINFILKSLNNWVKDGGTGFLH